MGPDQAEGEAFSPERDPAHRRALSFAVAVAVHLLILWGLATPIVLRFLEPPEHKSEPKIFAVAPRIVPPPPDVERLGSSDVVTTQPRFRPRMPAMVRERREGDPALAVWKYLCNRDSSLSEATRRNCPEFHLGDVDLGTLDPLNRTGDSGVMLGADTATMSLEEAGRAKRWIKPKMPWSGDGARAKDGDLGLPGHDPFAVLPK